jgi:hypothetical protein
MELTLPFSYSSPYVFEAARRTNVAGTVTDITGRTSANKLCMSRPHKCHSSPPVEHLADAPKFLHRSRSLTSMIWMMDIDGHHLVNCLIEPRTTICFHNFLPVMVTEWIAERPLTRFREYVKARVARITQSRYLQPNRRHRSVSSFRGLPCLTSMMYRIEDSGSRRYWKSNSDVYISAEGKHEGRSALASLCDLPPTALLFT